MRAFSKLVDGVIANEIGGYKGDTSLGIAGQATSVAPKNKAFILAPCDLGSSWAESDVPCACETGNGLSRVSYGVTERLLKSTRASTTPNVSAVPLHPNCCHSEEELDEEHRLNSNADVVHAGNGSLAGGSAARPEPLLVMPAGFIDEAVEGMEDNDIAAADWLVSHALLDSVD